MVCCDDGTEFLAQRAPVKILEAQEGAVRNDPVVCWTLLPCDIGGCSLLLLARRPHAYCGIKRRHTSLSDDKDLLDRIAKLQGEGVYIGVQAEWIDRVGCFSNEVCSQIGYILFQKLIWTSLI
jgi:hypothetical protein